VLTAAVALRFHTRIEKYGVDFWEFWVFWGKEGPIVGILEVVGLNKQAVEGFLIGVLYRLFFVCGALWCAVVLVFTRPFSFRAVVVSDENFSQCEAWLPTVMLGSPVCRSALGKAYQRFLTGKFSVFLPVRKWEGCFLTGKFLGKKSWQHRSECPVTAIHS
jgi:hypothetical protein